jgi:hypothetical protein
VRRGDRASLAEAGSIHEQSIPSCQSRVMNRRRYQLRREVHVIPL